MSFLSDIKQSLTKSQLQLFKTQLKQMSPDQIIEMMRQNVITSAKEIIKEFDRGVSRDEIYEKWTK